MKILGVNAVYGMSTSTGRSVKEQSEALTKQGHISCVAYSKGDDDRTNLYKMDSRFGRKIHALFSRAFGLQGYFSTFSTWKFLRFIKKEKFDIVHLHNLHSNYINIYMLLKFLAKRKIATAVTLHDPFFYTGRCTHYTLVKCYKWQDRCGNCPRLHRDNKSWFFDFSSKMLRDKQKHLSEIEKLAVIGVSDWITNEASKSILKDAKIVKRIYNWIDLELFKPTDVSELKEKFGNKFIVLGVSSQWDNSKGLNYFIELADALDENMIIVMVGKMPNDQILPDNIIPIPVTKDMHELVKYYNMADVFVQLSQEETFGKVTAEALACGIPVIVFNKTANPELAPENCGYILEEPDIAKLTDKIAEVKAKGKSSFSEHTRQFAYENFDKETNIAETIRLYEELLEA